MIDTSNSSTNDIVNSETITVNNVTWPSNETIVLMTLSTVC